MLTRDLRPISGRTELKSGSRHLELLRLLERLSKNPRCRAFAGQDKLGQYLAERAGRAKPYSERQIRRLLTDLAADGAIVIERPDRTEQNLIRVAIGADELEAEIGIGGRRTPASRRPIFRVIQGGAGASRGTTGRVQNASSRLVPTAADAPKTVTEASKTLASKHELATEQGERPRRILYRWKIKLPTAYVVRTLSDKADYRTQKSEKTNGRSCSEKMNTEHANMRTAKKLSVDNQTFSTVRNDAEILTVDNLRETTVSFLDVDKVWQSTPSSDAKMLTPDKQTFSGASDCVEIQTEIRERSRENVRSNVRSTAAKMSARHMETLDNRQYETELRPFRPVLPTTTTAAPEFVDRAAQREPDVVAEFEKPKTTAGEVAAKLVTRLVAIGVAVKVAVAIANTFSPQLVITQIASLPYRVTKSNRAGLLVQSIRDDFPVPDSARGAVSYALREWAALIAPPAAATAENVAAAAAEVADVDEQLLEAMSAEEKARLEQRAREDLDAHLEEKNLRRMIRVESPAYSAMLHRRMLESAAAIAGGTPC